MSAVASIVLADALATPVNHTFIPLGQDSNGVWWFEDQSQASPIGYWRVSIEIRRPVTAKNGDSSKDRMNRVITALHMPTLETLSNSTVSGIEPAPTVAWIERSKTEYMVPERATLQNRKDLRKMTQNLQANTMVVDCVESLQPIF